MTKQRYDVHSTEFGLWLRKQKELDSSQGFIATNIDYVWRNYKTKKWILIEEKRYMSKPAFYQEEIFNLLKYVCSKDNNYNGFYLIQFENTSPDNGRIYLNHQEITKEKLIKFLRFENP